MKLPRKIAAEGTVGELQSARNMMITPEEAANVELAKYGALASAASSIGDVLESMAEIKAKEEYSSAVAVYESALVDLDDEIRRTPDQLDAAGIPTYDPDEVVMMERDRRRSITDEIRKGIKSSRAQRSFDAMIAKDKPRREELYLNETFQKQVKNTKLRTDTVITSLVNKGQTEIAKSYLTDNIAVYGAGGYAVKIAEINKGQTLYRLNRATGSPTVTETELEVVLESLDNNAWPDGDLNLTSNEVYAWQTKIHGKIKAMQEQPSIEAERASKALFDNLVPDFLDGNKSVEDLSQYRGSLEDEQYNKLLGYAVTERRRPTASSPAVLKDYEDRTSQLVLGYPADEMGFVNWADTVDDMIHAMSMDESISKTDYNRMKTELETSVKTLRAKPELKSMLDVEYQKLTGHTVAQSILGTVPKDKTAQIAGSRLLRDYYREVARLGPDEAVEGATKWLENNIPRYHAGVSDGILSKYKITDVPMRDGTIDYLKLEIQMIEYKQAQAEQQLISRGYDGVEDQAGRDQLMRDTRDKALLNAKVSFGVYKNQTKAQ